MIPTDLLIGPAIVMAIILSLIEVYFVARDEAGMRWFAHAMHAIPFMFIFTFVAMNIGWAFGLIGIEGNFMYDLGARILIGIIAMVKIKAAASITGKGGVGESNLHVFIIGVLIVASPYIWVFALERFLGPLIPF